MARTPNRFGGGSRTNEYGLFFEQTTERVWKKVCKLRSSMIS